MAFKDIGGLEPEVISGLGGHTKKGVANPVTITGYYYGVIQRPKKDKPGEFQSVHLFKTEKQLIGIWGVGNLDEKMSFATPGNKCRVTFKEAKPTRNGKEFKIYRCEEDPDDHIDPPKLPEPKAQAAPQRGQPSNASFGTIGEEDIPF